MILPAVSLSRISPPRGGEYPHEVTAGSMSAHALPLFAVPRWRSPDCRPVITSIYRRVGRVTG
ncbi:hypothetical protein BRC95_03050 [Halobacteriales archaeon QS_5_68_33]|nr:MAG: hypothetical protein BRC95_03050 [Halobacteriales archaeon QS_5_68_33]